MGMLRVLSRRGDDHTTWDVRLAVLGDAEAQAAIAEAERVFQEQRARGATAFTIEQGRAPVRVDTFDPQAEQIVMVPRVVGG